VAIDERLVDARPAGDAADAGVLHPALVEQRPDCVDDPALARSTHGRPGL
jgi:hypothetical protein